MILYDVFSCRCQIVKVETALPALSGPVHQHGMPVGLHSVFEQDAVFETPGCAVGGNLVFVELCAGLVIGLANRA